MDKDTPGLGVSHDTNVPAPAVQSRNNQPGNEQAKPTRQVELRGRHNSPEIQLCITEMTRRYNKNAI